MLSPVNPLGSSHKTKHTPSTAALKRSLSIIILLYLEGKIPLHDVLDLASTMQQETTSASDPVLQGALAKLAFLSNQIQSGMQDAIKKDGIIELLRSLVEQLRKEPDQE